MSLSKLKTVSNIHVDLYGDHETMVSEGTEADLHKHYTGCKKNPGHAQFTPCKKFTKHHLPNGLKDKNVYKLIRAVADLTVRVNVTMVSPERPEFWPDTNVPYPFHNTSGTVSMRTGSGFIQVIRYKDGYGNDGRGKRFNIFGNKYKRGDKTCPCEKCKNSNKPSKVWWEIILYTATHVVFDDIEASHMSCRLFYDEQDSPLVRLDKFSIKLAHVENDACSLAQARCDKLGKKLFNIVKRYHNFSKKVDNMNISEEKFSFIVSHPHGCPKQVSTGQCVDIYKMGEFKSGYNLAKLTYSTCTCPGSSGAWVHCAGFISHLHCGTLSSGLNYSSVGYTRK